MESSCFSGRFYIIGRKMGKRILNISNVRKTVNYLKKNGIKHAYYAARERIEEERRSDYSYRAPKERELAVQREKGRQLPYRFSIIVPAYETKETFLREMIDSVREQSYERWELIITDAGRGDGVERIIREYQEKGMEHRIRYLRLKENKGISENTNAGIEAAVGDYIGLLDHDDVLTKDALYEMAAAICKAEEQMQEPILLYSDEDKYISDNNSNKRTNGNYCKNANIKGKFNFDLILSNNYICHFMVIKAGVMKKMKLRGEYDGAQDYDLVLRIIDHMLTKIPIQKLEERIIHIPKVLYHWRCHEHSTAENTASKTYAYEAGKAALEAFCQNRGWKTEISHSLHLGFYRIKYLPDLFTVRSEAGMIGGRILDGKNKIASGIYNEEGKKLYYGLHKEYSGGSTHKAVLMQDCTAVDIRCMRLRAELHPLFKEITGVTYEEARDQKLADVSAITCDEEGYRKLSMELGKAVAARGYLIIWDPQITIKLSNL